MSEGRQTSLDGAEDVRAEVRGQQPAHHPRDVVCRLPSRRGGRLQGGQWRSPRLSHWRLLQTGRRHQLGLWLRRGQQETADVYKNFTILFRPGSQGCTPEYRPTWAGYRRRWGSDHVYCHRLWLSDCLLQFCYFSYLIQKPILQRTRKWHSSRPCFVIVAFYFLLRNV